MMVMMTTDEIEFPDVLMGGAGDDTLTGSIGVDVLMGGDGHDTIIGGAGVDKIVGGAGDDVMTGSGVNALGDVELDGNMDTFVFSPTDGEGDDVIVDLENGIRIGLTSVHLSFRIES